MPVSPPTQTMIDVPEPEAVKAAPAHPEDERATQPRIQTITLDNISSTVNALAAQGLTDVDDFDEGAFMEAEDGGHPALPKTVNDKPVVVVRIGRNNFASHPYITNSKGHCVPVTRQNFGHLPLPWNAEGFFQQGDLIVCLMFEETHRRIKLARKKLFEDRIKSLGVNDPEGKFIKRNEDNVDGAVHLSGSVSGGRSLSQIQTAMTYG